MNPQDITLRAVTTVAGAVLVIEMTLELFVKPALANLPAGVRDRWGRLACNGAAFAVGLAATLAAARLTGLTTAADVGQMVLAALAAASLATAGYEVASNARRAARG